MPLTDIRKAVGYIRVSTSKQETDTPSLDNQASRIREWAARHGYVLLGIYEDTASGRKEGSVARRPGLRQAITEANREEADIVMTTVSRLSRNPADEIEIDRLLKGKIITAAEPDRRTGARSRRVIKRSVADAAAEADALSRRTSGAMQRLVAAGKHPDNLGSKRAAAYASSKVRRVNADIAIEDIARVLAESPAHRQLSTRALADLLNARGFRSGTGKLWSKDGLRRPRRAALRFLDEQAALDGEMDGGLCAPAAIQTDGFHVAAATEPEKPAQADRTDPRPNAENSPAADRVADEAEEHPYRNHPLFGLF